GERGGQLGRVRVCAGIEERGHRVGESVGVNGRHGVVPSSAGRRAPACPDRQAAGGRGLPAS
ncbi:DUF3300 domain-containing protein, partial [Burkholderia multivorans]